jgi:hypothetical protein
LKGKLRHPVRSITEPFGKAGLTVAVIALVMALVGGAYAAGGLTKSQEKQVKKIAKKYAGKPGATGPAGAAGTNGTNGKDGVPGAPGKDGVSPTGTAFSGAQHGCSAAGGVEYKGATTNYVCNGKEGPQGTFGGETLPSGQTLKGHWGAASWGEEGFPNPGLGQAVATVSYALPVGEGVTTHYIQPEESNPPGCTGNVENPGAKPGSLCVFAAIETNVGLRAVSPDAIGFTIIGATAAKGRIALAGTWAVTAE